MLALSTAAGVNVAVVPLTFTVPATTAPPVVLTTVKLALFNVETVMASEKVAEIEEFSVTPFAAFEGDVFETSGGVVSRIAGEMRAAGVSFGDSSAPPPQPNKITGNRTPPFRRQEQEAVVET